MSGSLEAYIKKPSKLMQTYQQIIKQPRTFFEVINTKESIEISLLFIGGLALISSLIGAVVSPFGFATVIWAPLFAVVFTGIACGIFHLMRGFLEAEGGFNEYMAYTAWYALLTFPVQLLLQLSAPMGGLMGLGSLLSLAIFAGWFFGFFRIFNSSQVKTAIVAMAIVVVTSVPAMMMMAVSQFTAASGFGDPGSQEFYEKVQELQEMQAEMAEDDEDQVRRRIASAPKKRSRSKTRARDNSNECTQQVTMYKQMLKQVYIMKGAKERDKVRADLKQGLKENADHYKKVIAEAGGEKALLKRASEFPEDADQYKQMVMVQRCYEKAAKHL